MSKQNELREIRSLLRDHEKRIVALEGKPRVQRRSKIPWYKPGSTVDKVVPLVEEGYFDLPRSMNEMISELKTRDYHLKPSDLTLPLRKIVRNGILKRTKINADDSPSRVWLFVKA